ncbi:MAG: nucleoside 2-deoxyribosyltransferase [Oligoflexia bacterium]|nr:nucleoside 2-deoxyribosyltransferase [Oligoflexia bacterium]
MGVSNRDASEINCPVCIRYQVTRMELHSLEKEELPAAQRVLVISQTIRDARSGMVTIWSSGGTVEKPYIVRKLGDYAGRTISHAGKPDALLETCAKKLAGLNPFQHFRLEEQDAYLLQMDGFREMQQWLRILLDQKLLESETFEKVDRRGLGGTTYDVKTFPFYISAKGWARIEELFRNVNSNKAFIAMAFGHSERASIQKAVEDACAATGWEAFTIDKKEHINGITDEIIASINQSRFIVAEFTGNNPGVYYEAGYAAGKGIPVVLVVKKAQLDDQAQGVHFDTRHINHIAWTDYDDLKKKLINRINAVIPRSSEP